MAAAYIKVWFEDKLIRTFGGNNSDVRELEKCYKSLGKKYLVEFYRNK